VRLLNLIDIPGRSEPDRGEVHQSGHHGHGAHRVRALAIILVLAAMIGLASAGLVLAADDPTPSEVTQTAALINTIRARLPSCTEEGLSGQADAMQASAGTDVPRRPSLIYNPRLSMIASRHAQAMASQHFFDHVDPSGRTVGRRATEGGYAWRVVGENLAAGQETIAEAVRDWLLSTTHCRNLIDPRFTEFGIAQAHSSDPSDAYGSYWVLVLGKPLSGAMANAAR
jgi:uncharacterized protein YkwD